MLQYNDTLPIGSILIPKVLRLIFSRHLMILRLLFAKDYINHIFNASCLCICRLFFFFLFFMPFVIKGHMHFFKRKSTLLFFGHRDP